MGGDEKLPCSRFAFCCCTHCATDDMLSPATGIGEPLLAITDVMGLPLVARWKAFLLAGGRFCKETIELRVGRKQGSITVHAVMIFCEI